MASLKKIATIDHVVQAKMLEAWLNDQHIPHLIHSYHDSAYDGLFQGQKGWGYVEAPEAHAAEILALLENLRQTDEPPEQGFRS
jgi:hypothetical protein